MNKIFKVIWSHTTQSWVAVSELTKAHGKTKSVATVATVVVLAGGAIDAQAVITDNSGGGVIAVSGNDATPPVAGNGNSIAIGNRAKASGTGKSIAIGSVSAQNENATTVMGNFGIAIGSTEGGSKTGTVAADKAIAIGTDAAARGGSSIVIGNNSYSNKTGIVIGNGAINEYSYDTVMGIGAKSVLNAVDSSAPHDTTKGNNPPAVVIGYNANSSSIMGDVVIGAWASSNFSATDRTFKIGQATAIGSRATVYGDQGNAIGGDTLALGNSSIAIGGDDINLAASSILKYVPTASKYIQIYTWGGKDWEGKIYPDGSNVRRVTSQLQAAGKTTQASLLNTNRAYVQTTAGGDASIAIGPQAMTLGVASQAYGVNALAMGHSSISMGSFATAGRDAEDGTNTVAIGSVSAALGNSAVAVGRDSTSYARNDVAVGYRATAGFSHAPEMTADAKVKLAELQKASQNGQYRANVLASLQNAWNSFDQTTKEEINKFLDVSIKSTMKSNWKVNGLTEEQLNQTGFEAILAYAEAIKNGEQNGELFPNAGEFKQQLKALLEPKEFGADAVAVGRDANAIVTNGIAIGTGAQVGDVKDTTATGINVQKTNGIAIGKGSVVTGNSSIAVGVENRVSGDYSGTFGDPSIVDGTESYTFGNDNVVGNNTTGAFAVGNNNQLGATPAYVAGTNKVDSTQALTGAVDVSGSAILGSNNKVTTQNTFILGSGINTADDGKTAQSGTVANSVYLGKDSTAVAGNAAGTKNKTAADAEGESTTAGDTGKVNEATVAGVNYQGFQGNTADGVVTVGSAGKERRIQNVAAGEISSTSTDAINGSQLYLTHKAIDDVARNIPFKYTVKDQTGNNTPVINIDGKFYNPNDLTNLQYDPKTKAFYNKADGSPATAPTEVPANTVNVSSAVDDTNSPDTLNNIKGNLPQTTSRGDKTQNGNTTLPTTGPGVAEGTKKQDAPTDIANIYNNAATVGDVLNAGWNLQENGDERDFVKPYDTVNFVNGQGSKVNVTRNDDGKINNVRIDTLTTLVDKDGNPVIQIGNEYYKAEDIDPKTGKPIQGKAAITLADNPLSVNVVNPTAANNKTPTTDPIKMGNVAASAGILDGTNRGDKSTANTPTTIDPARTALKDAYNGLADLANANDTNVMTVADAKNLGWVVSSDKTTGNLGTEYADDVRNANEVRFVGTGSAIVSGRTDDDVRTITVTVQNNLFNYEVTKVADGSPVTTVVGQDGNVYAEEDLADTTFVNGKYYKTAEIQNGQPQQTATPVVPAPNNEAEYKTVVKAEGVKPRPVANIAGTLTPSYNKGNPKVTDGTANKDDEAQVADVTKQIINPFDTANPTKAVTAEEIAKVYNNAATVGDVLNAGWNLQGNGEAKDFVKPYDTVNFVNGQGTTVSVETSEDGKVSNIRVDALTTLVDKDGNPVIQVDGKYYKADDIDPKTGKPKINLQGQAATEIDTVTNPLSLSAVNPTTTKANGKTATTDPIKMGNVAAGAGTLDGTNRGDKPTANTPTVIDQARTALAGAYNGLADLANAKDTNVMTVADAKNLGWVVSSDKETDNLGTEYADDVRNANEVRFVGTGLATVSGKTVDDVRIITVDVDAQKVATQTPIIYTDKDGNKLVKGKDGNFYPADSVEIDGKYYPAGSVKAQDGSIQKNGQAANSLTGKQAGDVSASMNDGGNTPMNLANVKGNLAPTYNKDNPKVTADGTADKNSPAATNDVTKQMINPFDTANPTKAVTAEEIAKVYNNAATVGDVLNAGWNLQGNGEAKDFVKPYDTVNFADGVGTTVSVEVSEDGKVSTIKVNSLTQFTDANGTPVTVIDGKGYELGAVKGKDGNIYPKDVEFDPQTGAVTNNKTPLNPITDNPQISFVDTANGSTKKLTVLGNVAAGTNTYGEKGKDANTPLVKVGDKYYAPDQFDDKGKLVNGAQPTELANGVDFTSPVNKARIGLADLEHSNPTNVMTVADAKNLGWVVSSDKTTGNLTAPYADKVTNAKEVKFVGTGLATVSGETKDDVRIITVDVDAQKVAAQTPIIYTDKDGNKLVKGKDGNFYPADSVEIDGQYYPKGSTKQPDGTIQKDGQTATALTPKQAGDVSASMNDGGNDPMNLANVKGNLVPTYNKNNPTIGANGTADKNTAANDVTKQVINPFNATSTDAASAEEIAKVYNNAATVGDVLNAGWNLQGNGVAKDFVKPYDTVNFADGVGSTVDVQTDEDGKVSTIKVNTLTQYTDEKGQPLVKVGDKYYPAGSVVAKDGKVYPEGTTFDTDGSTPTNGKNPVSAVTPKQVGLVSTDGNPIVLGNVAAGANTYADKGKDANTPLVKVGDKYYAPDQFENGKLKQDATPTDYMADGQALTSPVNNAKAGLADLENSNENNALTVADAKNLGWVVSSDKTTDNLTKEYADDVRNANEVRFVGVDGITVSGKTDNDVRTITVALEKGEVTTTNIDEPVLRVKGQADVPLTKVGDSYYKTEDLDPVTGLPKDNAQPITPDQLVNVVNKGNKGKGFVTGNQVGDAIQKSGWNLGKATNTELENTTFSDAAKNIEKVNPNDNVRFANGKGTIVKAGLFKKEDENGVITTTTTFKIDVDLPIAYEAKDTNGNELVKANDGKWYAKDKVDPETGRVTDPAATAVDKPATLEAKLTTNDPDEKAYEVKDPIEVAVAKAVEAFKKATPDATEEQIKAEAEKAREAEIAKDPSKKDEIKSGEGGVALNNVAWAEEPDQAVNKDQLDQTVNKSGFYVKQNGTSTEAANKNAIEDAKTEKVTPNDVLDFVDGGNTKATATTTREGGRDVTKVSVNVVGLPVQYTDAGGNPVAKVGDQFYPVKADGTPDLANPIPVDQVGNLVANVINPTAAPNTKGDATTLGNIKDNIGVGADGAAIDQSAGKPLVKPQDYDAATNGHNAATVNDVLRAGWNAYVDDVTAANHKATVNPTDNVVFKGTNGINVTSTGENNGTTVFEFSLEKGEVVKANEFTVTKDGQAIPAIKIGADYYAKEDIDPTTGHPKANTNPIDMANATVGENKGKNFVDGNQVAEAIQNSGFTLGKAKADSLPDAFNNADEKVNPNDSVRFADGKGTTVSLGTAKQIDANGEVETTTTIKVDVDLPIDFKYMKDGKEYVKANDGKFYAADKVNANGTLKDKNATALSNDDVKALSKQAQLTNGINTDGVANNPYTSTAFEADPAKPGSFKPKAYDNTNPAAKDDLTAQKGTGGVALNNVAWAENPDQAVNKDQLDQTVNKSGFFVKQNGNSTTTDPNKTEKVTPNDVVNFVNGMNTKVTAKTERDTTTGVDTTTVKVDLVGLPVQYTSQDGVPVTKVGDKFFTVDKDGNPTTTEVAADQLSVNVINPAAKPNEIGAPTKISNVADGDISPTSTDAVNGGQLYNLQKVVGGDTLKNMTTEAVTLKDKEGQPLKTPDGKDVTVDVVKSGDYTLKTYNVQGQTEYVTNNIIEAIGRMNEEGIKFFHVNDENVDKSKVQDKNEVDSSASAKFAAAIGYSASAAAEKAIALGYKAEVSGEQSIAIGDGATVSGTQSISIGTGNNVTGNHSGAFGDPNTVSGNGSYAVGNDNTVTASESFVLGNRVAMNVENSVALGADTRATAGNGVGTKNLKVDGTVGQTTTAGDKGKVDKANVNGVIYGGFAGDTAHGVVSVGAAGTERRIQNVAAGEISATSTDAINGSQLYQVAAKLGDINNQINRNNKLLRAGIAGANAAAGLPQVYIPGKSMVAASAGTYKGQNAIAVGYSRASDNGKLILKLQGNANSRGEFGGSVGVGYQW